MTRQQFYAWPLLISGLLLAAMFCWAAKWNPVGWLLGEAHQFARELGGR